MATNLNPGDIVVDTRNMTRYGFLFFLDATKLATLQRLTDGEICHFSADELITHFDNGSSNAH